jgi:hypothetical protein
MAIIQAEQWLELARKKQQLTTEQRRHVIAYMMSRPGEECPSKAEMAALFGVSDRTIGFDRKAIREAVAEEIKEEDVGLILADLRLCFEKTIRNIEKSAHKAKLGSANYLEHQKSLFKMQQDYVKGLQDLGVLPKELGTLHVDKFEFKASVGLEAAGRPVNMYDPPTIPAEIIETKALSNGENSGREAHEHSGDEQNTEQRDAETSKPTAPTSAQFSAVQADQCVGVPLSPGREVT